MIDAIKNFLGTTGIAKLMGEENWWQYIVMYVIIGALFYLAVVKKFEPLLLLPIAFGMLLANLPGANLIHLDFFFDTYYFNVENGEITGSLAYELEAFLEYLEVYGRIKSLHLDSNKDNIIGQYLNIFKRIIPQELVSYYVATSTQLAKWVEQFG